MNQKQINVAVIGAGWIGETRAITCGQHPLVRDLYIAERDPARAERVAQRVGAKRWVTDQIELPKDEIDAVIISAAPETTHYPLTMEWLAAGKHVLLEKPMALKLSEAEAEVELARKAGVKFTIGYTQRFNPKFAYVKQCVEDGTLGTPVTALASRNATRELGAKVAARGLGPAQMEATHDVDLILWWMEGMRPKRVYARSMDGVMRQQYDLPDSQWMMVTMENGATFTVGATWNLPREMPGFVSAYFEFVCTDGALFVDDTHRDVLLTTTQKGIWRPLSTMPGEQVGPVFAGPMENETRHFLDCVALDQPVLVKPEQALVAMEVTIAADLSAERGEPVDLPLPRDRG